MRERFNPNYKRDRLAEQVLCALVSNSKLSDTHGFTKERCDAFAGIALDIASAFVEATRPAEPDSTVAEVDEFFDESLIIDGE